MGTLIGLVVELNGIGFLYNPQSNPYSQKIDSIEPWIIKISPIESIGSTLLIHQ